MRAEGTRAYKLYLADLDLRQPAGDVITATGPEPTLPEAYKAFTHVFSEAESESLPSHGPKDLVIELTSGKQPLWGPIYNLSEKELATLGNYLEVKLKRGWIMLLTSSAGAQVFFMPEKDGTLQLCVDFLGLNQITKKNCYPRPLISESIDRLADACYFTKLNICEAYHKLRIATERSGRPHFAPAMVTTSTLLSRLVSSMLWPLFKATSTTYSAIT